MICPTCNKEKCDLGEACFHKGKTSRALFCHGHPQLHNDGEKCVGENCHPGFAHHPVPKQSNRERAEELAYRWHRERSLDLDILAVEVAQLLDAKDAEAKEKVERVVEAVRCSRMVDRSDEHGDKMIYAQHTASLAAAHSALEGLKEGIKP